MDNQKPMTEEELMMMAEEQQQPQIDPRLQAARDQRDKMQMYGNLLSGFQDLIKGATGYNPNYGTAEALKQQGNQAVKDYQVDQASKMATDKAKMEKDKNQLLMDKYSQELDKGKYDLSDQEKTRDPNSPESKIAQKFLLDLKPDLDPKSVEQLSAHQIYITNKPMQDFLVQKMKTDAEKYRLAQQDKRIAQADRRLEQGDEKEKGKQQRFDRAQDFKEKEKQELSDKQTEQLADYDNALELLADADKFKKNVDTGFVTNMSDKMRSYVGKGDIAVSDLKMAIGETLAQKVKSLSGTAVSDQERKFISEISLPTINDDDEEFKAKLKRAVDTINKAKQARIDAFKKQGKDPSAFEANGKQQKSVTKKQYSPSRNQTKLIYSDGTEEIVDGQQ